MSNHVDALKTELEAEIAALESEARRLEASEGPPAASATPLTDHYKQFLAQHAQRKRAAFGDSHRSVRSAQGPARELERRYSPADERFDDIEEAAASSHAGRGNQDDSDGSGADGSARSLSLSRDKKKTSGWRQLLLYDEDGRPRYSVIIVFVIAGIAVLLVVFMVTKGAAADEAQPPAGSTESADEINAAPEDSAGAETARSEGQGQTTRVIVLCVVSFDMLSLPLLIFVILKRTACWRCALVFAFAQVSVLIIGGCFCLWRKTAEALKPQEGDETPSILPSLPSECDVVVTSQSAAEVVQQGPAGEEEPGSPVSDSGSKVNLDAETGLKDSGNSTATTAAV